MTPEVRETDPDGVDFGWVMQVTFVVTIVLGSPTVATLSLLTTLPTWSDRATFAVRVGAAVWFVTLVSVYAYARQYRNDQDDEPSTTGESTESVPDSDEEPDV